jgi:hypothetical protein
MSWQEVRPYKKHKSASAQPGYEPRKRSFHPVSRKSMPKGALRSPKLHKYTGLKEVQEMFDSEDSSAPELATRRPLTRSRVAKKQVNPSPATSPETKTRHNHIFSSYGRERRGGKYVFTRPYHTRVKRQDPPEPVSRRESSREVSPALSTIVVTPQKQRRFTAQPTHTNLPHQHDADRETHTASFHTSRFRAQNHPSTLLLIQPLLSSTIKLRTRIRRKW